MTLQITTQPVSEPVTLAEAKLHLRVETSVTADDELIKSIIVAARKWCESYENKAYMLRTYQLKLDEFEDYIEIPNPPLVSVSSITYLDSAGATQTLASTVYDVDTAAEPGIVRLAYNQNWPSTYNYPNSVTINYVAGYATTFTAADTDILTVGNMVFAESDIVIVSTDSGDLPAPLVAGTNYYVRVVSGSTFKLATTDSDSTVVNISDAGTGTHFIAKANKGLVPENVKAAMKLIIGHLYEMRQPEIISGSLSKVEFGVKSLLFDRMF